MAFGEAQEICRGRHDSARRPARPCELLSEPRHRGTLEARVAHSQRLEHAARDRVLERDVQAAGAREPGEPVARIRIRPERRRRLPPTQLAQLRHESVRRLVAGAEAERIGRLAVDAHPVREAVAKRAVLPERVVERQTELEAQVRDHRLRQRRDVKAVVRPRVPVRAHDRLAAVEHADHERRHLPPLALPLDELLVDQCRKWRRPVTIIAAPAASTAATTSASRFAPPGWTIVAMPASSAACGPSANGKNASEASTAPARSCPCSRARSIAMRTASTRFGCPPPIPSVCSPFARTIAFDHTCLQTRHANSASPHCSSLTEPQTTLMPSRSSTSESRSCTSRPPSTRLYSRSPAVTPRRSRSTRRRVLGMAVSAVNASSAISGASSTSTNCSAIRPPSAPDTGRFSTTTPPYAESGSAARARS